MNLQEIINRPDGANFEVQELAFVVEKYIEQKKGREVRINLTKGLHPRHPFFRNMYYSQVKKLMVAYSVAESYFKQQNLK